MVTLSQISDFSTSSNNAAIEEEERRHKAIAKNLLKTHIAKQRKEIDKLNNVVEKTIKERDDYVKEMEADSLQIHDQAVKAAEAYFAENKGNTSTLCNEILSQLDKTCHSMVELLIRESELIDPDDAEDVAHKYSQNYSRSIRDRMQWRRRLVKENHNELKEHEARLQAMVNPDEMVKSVLSLANVNQVW